MLVLTRLLARQLRSLLRRAFADQRPPRAGPVLCCHIGPEGLLVESVQGQVAVRYHDPTVEADQPERLAFHGLTLASLEGRQPTPVLLDRQAPDKGQARWSEGTVAHVQEMVLLPAAAVPSFPKLPEEEIPIAPAFLTALDQASRIATQDSARYALTRVQLRGRPGDVVATDGRQLYRHGGFSFPWTTSLLVPRLTVFGSRELASADQVYLGVTETHVSIRVGAWTFLLALDQQGRFPNVDEVMPREAKLNSRLHLAVADVQFLTDTLPKLPGAEEHQAPLTLELGQPPVVRARAEDDAQVVEVALTQSECSGQPLRLRLARDYLRRALQWGFTDLAFAGAEQPVLCRDSTRQYLFLPLDAKAAIPPTPTAVRLGTPPTPSPPPSRKEPAMPQPANHGHNADASPARSSTSNGDGASLGDLLLEVEALRTQLQEATSRTARLLAALKLHRRHSRAVESAMSALRQLQFDR